MSTIIHEAFLKLSAELRGKYKKVYLGLYGTLWQDIDAGTYSRFTKYGDDGYIMQDVRLEYTYLPQPGDLVRCERFESHRKGIEDYFGHTGTIKTVLTNTVLLDGDIIWPISALTPVEKDGSDTMPEPCSICEYYGCNNSDCKIIALARAEYPIDKTHHRYVMANRQDGFITGYKSALKQLQSENERLRADKWISTSDLLPSVGVEVIAFDIEGWPIIASYKDIENWRDNNGESCIVTHWQPLPEPPKTESK